MYFRNWIIIAAITLGLIPPALAQQEVQEPPVEPGSAQQQIDEEAAVESESVVTVTPSTDPSSTPHDSATAEDSESHLAQEGYLIYGDGWAQWFMALTGVGALFLSAWAVWLLKRTLDATRDAVRSADDAVDVTRQMGEAQTKAYVGIERCNIRRNGEITTFELHVVNSGQTPAHIVDFVWNSAVINGTTIPDMKFDTPTTDRGPLQYQPEMHLPPTQGRPVVAERTFKIDKDSWGQVHDGTALIICGGDLTYIDVFRKTWLVHFQFTTGGPYPPIEAGRLTPTHFNKPERLKEDDETAT